MASLMKQEHPGCGDWIRGLPGRCRMSLGAFTSTTLPPDFENPPHVE